MTFEELKVEADKQGYALMKKQKYIGLKKCPSCNKRAKIWRGFKTNRYVFISCDKCGLRTPDISKEREARIEWNKLVEEISRKEE